MIMKIRLKKEKKNNKPNCSWQAWDWGWAAADRLRLRRHHPWGSSITSQRNSSQALQNHIVFNQVSFFHVNYNKHHRRCVRSSLGLFAELFRDWGGDCWTWSWSCKLRYRSALIISTRSIGKFVQVVESDACADGVTADIVSASIVRLCWKSASRQGSGMADVASDDLVKEKVRACLFVENGCILEILVRLISKSEKMRSVDWCLQ